MTAVTPPPAPPGNPFGEDPKAVAAAAKAYAKAQRPWFKKKRIILPLAFVGIIGVSTAASGGSDSSKPTGTDGVESVSTNKSNPPQADLESNFECATDDIGWATAKGRLTNHSSEPSNYIIEVTYTADGVQYATGTAFVNNVASGVLAEWEANSVTEARVGTTCEITDIERFAS